MADRFRLTLAQANPTVGDIAGNAARARSAWETGRAAGAGLVALPELFLAGYQPQDLVLKPAFVAACMEAAGRLAAACADGPALGIGCPWSEGGRTYNAWLVLAGGRIAARVLKHHLPNESVFDERRLYASGPISGPLRIGPIRIGVPICEDAWHPDVAETLAETGAELLLVPNGSPYARGRLDDRMGQMVARVVETGLPLAYLNMVGGQDDQVFDGASFVLNPGGALALSLPAFAETVTHADFVRGPDGWRAEAGPRALYPEEIEADYRAMVTGLADYCGKSGIGAVLLGLSGGVDSALVATIAADALGPGQVRAVRLPSEYTAPESLADAAEVARRLGLRLDTIPIEGPRAAVVAALAPVWGASPPRARPGGAPDSAPESAPDSSPESAPESAPDSAPGRAAPSALDGARTGAAGRTRESTPGSAPNIPPDGAADGASDSGAGRRAAGRSPGSSPGSSPGCSPACSPGGAAGDRAAAANAPDIAGENIQSRLRGLLLMALSNRFGEMLLTTGNKSELAVGYATIYGDMAGGFNPIKDLYKTRVFATCRWRNGVHRPWMKGPPGEVIPERVIAKPPSAELRPDQRDEDSLPPYPLLDRILEGLVERDAAVAELVAEGLPEAEVRRVEAMLYAAEWKRHQAAPGVRLTRRAFWLDRRYPIVNRWRDPG